MAECSSCSRPAPDATICPSCTGQAAAYLRQVPWLCEQLDITLTRQARMGDRNGPRSTETPVYFDQRASVDLETFRLDLARWATTVAEHRGISIDADNTPAGLSRWLLRWNGAAAQHPDAGDYLAELAAMIRAAERTIDRAPDMRCLGPCDVDGCVAWLYVPVHADIAYCPSPDCDAQYRVEDRRAWLLEQTVDRLMTAAEIARDLPWIAGITIDRKRINRWSSDGRIARHAPHPHDARKAATFRVGEVIDLARAEAMEAATKRSANGAA
jgi:hypothetical protein